MFCMIIKCDFRLGLIVWLGLMWCYTRFDVVLAGGSQLLGAGGVYAMRVWCDVGVVG